MSTPYNRAAAFTAYCKGEEPESIAMALAIPLDTLKDWIRSEGWRRLAIEFQSLLPATVPENRAEREFTLFLRGHFVRKEGNEDLTARGGTGRFVAVPCVPG